MVLQPLWLSEYFLSLEEGSFRLSRVNFCNRAGQHILVNKEEICILALADAASLILDEHLLGAVDGQSSECLLASQEKIGGTDSLISQNDQSPAPCNPVDQYPLSIFFWLCISYK